MQDLQTIKYGDTLKLVNYNKESTASTAEENEMLAQFQNILEGAKDKLGNITVDDTKDNQVQTGNTNNSDAYNLKVRSVINETFNIAGPAAAKSGFSVIVNEETFKNILRVDFPTYNEVPYLLYVDTDNTDEAVEEIEKMNKENSENQLMVLFNFYDMRSAWEYQGYIKKAVVYSFLGFVILFSIVNIYNTILTSISLRKREIAILKSMGMSKKQLNKMLFLESLFYGLDSTIYGSLISFAILYIRYFISETNKQIYGFNMPWMYLIISIFVLYTVILIATKSGKKKLKNQNIIDEIRDENI